MPAKHSIFNTLNWPNASCFFMLVVFIPIILERLGNTLTQPKENKNFLSLSHFVELNQFVLINFRRQWYLICVHISKANKKTNRKRFWIECFQNDPNRILVEDAIAIAISLIVFIHFEYCVLFFLLVLCRCRLVPLLFLAAQLSSADYFAGGNFFYLPYN